VSGIAGGPTDGSGWFHDPAGSANLRWWDGARWTEHLIDPTTGVAPAAAQAVAEPVAAEPVAVQPVAAQPVTSLPVAETVSAQPVAQQPVAEQPVTPPAAEQSGSVPLTRRELREQQSSGAAPAASEPAAQQPAAQPVSPEPMNFDSLAAGPVVFEPAAEAPEPAPFVWGLGGSPATAEEVPAEVPAASFEQLMAASAAGNQSSDAQPLAAQPSAPLAQTFAPSAVDPATAAAQYSPASAGVGQPWIAAPPALEDLYALRTEDPTYEPTAGSTTPVAPTGDVASGSLSTTAIWVYAALPVLHFALAWFVYERLKPVDDTGIRWVVLLGPIVIYLILAAIDRSRLVANGHTTAPSALLALVPPLYIGIRAARLGLGAVIPAVVWLLLQAAVILALVSVFPTLASQLTGSYSATPAAIVRPTATVLTSAQRTAQLTPAGMAAKITSDFAAKKITFTEVTCPVIPNIFDGAQTVCVAKLTGGTENLNVSVTTTDPHSAFAVVSVGALVS
jgi:hypothetical protein